MNFLVTEGYVDAARAFEEDSGTAPGVDLSSITDRMEIRKAVHSGDVDAAIERVNDINPELLEQQQELFFHLQQQRLIELIRQGKTLEALEFAQEYLAPQGEENPAFLEELGGWLPRARAGLWAARGGALCSVPRPLPLLRHTRVLAAPALDLRQERARPGRPWARAGVWLGRAGGGAISWLPAWPGPGGGPLRQPAGDSDGAALRRESCGPAGACRLGRPPPARRRLPAAASLPPATPHPLNPQAPTLTTTTTPGRPLQRRPLPQSARWRCWPSTTWAPAHWRT
jgi:hypothetical protein